MKGRGLFDDPPSPPPIGPHESGMHSPRRFLQHDNESPSLSPSFHDDPENHSDSNQEIIILDENIVDDVVLLEAPSAAPQPQFLLQAQFLPIKSTMEIPPEEYKRALETTNNVAKFFSASIESFRATMFRHTHLKLRDPTDMPESKLLIHIGDRINMIDPLNRR